MVHLVRNALFKKWVVCHQIFVFYDDVEIVSPVGRSTFAVRPLVSPPLTLAPPMLKNEHSS